MKAKPIDRHQAISNTFAKSFGPKPKDIKNVNTSLPQWPDEMNWFQKFLCLYGYHKWKPREAGPSASYPGMKLRDQCDRCETLR